MTENYMASTFVAVPQAYMFKECQIGLLFSSWMLTVSTHRNRFHPRFKKKNGATMYLDERSNPCRHGTCYGEC